MSVPTPHYLLFSESSRSADDGQWRFMLRATDRSDEFEASDVEPEVRGERLDLLTMVRALESLDQPSRVTLVGCSSYIRQGIQYGLPEWRDNGWRWEFFGQMVPVKNCDLWQRLDRVMRFHEVESQWRRIDSAHDVPTPMMDTQRPWGGEFRRQAGKTPALPAVRRRSRRLVPAAIARLWRRRIGGLWRLATSWFADRAKHQGSVIEASASS